MTELQCLRNNKHGFTEIWDTMDIYYYQVSQVKGNARDILYILVLFIIGV